MGNFFTDPTLDYTEIWAATTNDRNAAVMVGITRDGKFQHQGLGNAAIRYYWARTVNVFQESSVWYPASATAGVQGVTISDPTDVLKLLNADVTDAAANAYLAGTSSLIEILDTRNMLFELGVVGPGVAATYTQAIAQASSEMNLNKNLLQTLNGMVSGLITAPYNAGTAYVIGNFCTGTDSKIYQCILATTGNAPPNATYWKLSSDMITLVNTIQSNLDAATATWTSTASSLTANLAALSAPVTGRVTIAETNITQNATGILLTGQSITGPLACVAGAVLEPGVQIESVADVKGLEVQISKTRISMDSANANITLNAERIDSVSGGLSSATISLDGIKGAIGLTAYNAGLAGQIDVLPTMIGLKLNATGTVGPGLTIGWTDGTHTRSNITMLSDTFMMAKSDGTGLVPVFSGGVVGGVTTVGVNGNLLVAGSVSAAAIAAGALIVGTNVALGTAQTAAQVTTIVGGVVTTGFVNALVGVIAGSVAAENITGTVLTGKTIQTAASGERFVVDVASKAAHFYDSAGAQKVWIGTSTLGGYNSFGVFGSTVTGNSTVGLVGASNTGNGLVGITIAGAGVLGQSTSGTGIVGNGGMYGGFFLSGSKGAILLDPTGTNPSSSDLGAMIYNGVLGHFYGYTSGGWKQLDN